mmetsp:Transcript_50240/g.144524  ORF Transcript_50240/g.144524 Transcript_50240/m.144524 type:complete len:186 (-) Transcript_50240:52-609(-)
MAVAPMSRALARLPMLAAPRLSAKGPAGSGTAGARFRLAPVKDDLRSRAPERGGWVPGLGDLEGEGTDAARSEEGASAELDAAGLLRAAAGPAEADPSDDLEVPPVWASTVFGVAAHQECYGTPSKGKWKVRFHERDGNPHTPARRATIPTSMAALVASGQPKEEIYRAIREAYDVSDGGGRQDR